MSQVPVLMGLLCNESTAYVDQLHDGSELYFNLNVKITKKIDLMTDK